MDEVFDFTLRMGDTHIHLNILRNLHESKDFWDSSSHNHPGFELHVLLGGSCRVDVDGKTHKLGKGQVILIAPGRYHRPIATSGSFERISVAFMPAEGDLRRSLLEATGSCKVFPVGDRILELCRSIVEECPVEQPFQEAVLSSQLTVLLGSCFRSLGISDGDSSRRETNFGKYTDQIDGFFEHCLDEGATLDHLAEKLHLSRSQVNRVLKARYGITFREKLIRTRMEQAVWLLRNTDRSVTEIAGDVGYTSESRFYKMFRERFGTTPDAYRKQKTEE